MVIMLSLLIGTMSLPVFADGGNIQIVPPPATESGEFLSEKIPMENYLFDTIKFKMTEFIGSIIVALANVLFFLNLLLSRLTNYLLVQGFTLEIFTYIEAMFDSIIFAVRDSLYAPLVGIILPIVGLSMVFYLVVNKSGTAIQIFLSTVAVLFIAGAAMTSPTASIKAVNELSSSVSQSILSSTASVVEGKKVAGKAAVVNLSNIYWKTAVVSPWEIIEFGSIQTGDYSETLLNETPGSDARKNLVKRHETNILFKAEGQVLRLAMMIFILIINICMSILIIILSGFMFIAQFAAIIASVVAVCGFVMALLPNMGLRVAINGIYNVFEFILTRLAVTLLFVIYFVISTSLYKGAGEAGWFGVMLLQLALLVTIVFERRKIFGFMYAVKNGQGAAISNMNKQPKNDMFPMAMKAYAYTKMGQDVKGMWDRRGERKLEDKYKPLAEEYLYKQYNTDKNLRKRADERVAQGFKPFSVDEIQNTTAMMVKLHKQGETPDRLLMTSPVGKSDDQIKSEQRSLESQIYDTENTLKKREDQNQTTLDRVVRGDKASQHYNMRAAREARRKTVVNESFNRPGNNDSEFWSKDKQPENNMSEERDEVRATGTTGTTENVPTEVEITEVVATESDKVRTIIPSEDQAEATESNQSDNSEKINQQASKPRKRKKKDPVEKTNVQETSTEIQESTQSKEHSSAVNRVNVKQQNQVEEEVTMKQETRTDRENVVNRTENIDETLVEKERNITNESKNTERLNERSVESEQKTSSHTDSVERTTTTENRSINEINSHTEERTNVSTETQNVENKKRNIENRRVEVRRNIKNTEEFVQNNSKQEGARSKINVTEIGAYMNARRSKEEFLNKTSSQDKGKKPEGDA